MADFPTLVNWDNKSKPTSIKDIADYFADEIRFGQKDLNDTALSKLCNALTPAEPPVSNYVNSGNTKNTESEGAALAAQEVPVDGRHDVDMPNPPKPFINSVENVEAN